MVGREDDNEDAEEKDGTEARTHGKKTRKGERDVREANYKSWKKFRGRCGGAGRRKEDKV